MKYLYRIVNVIFAALVFPAALFLDGIILRASTTLADVGIMEKMTFKKIIDILMGNDTFFGIPFESSTFMWPEALEPANGKLIAAAVFFVLTFVAAIFIIFGFQQQTPPRCDCCGSRHHLNDYLLRLLPFGNKPYH